jgi:hypothetical protein
MYRLSGCHAAHFILPPAQLGAGGTVFGGRIHQRVPLRKKRIDAEQRRART